MAYTRSGGEHAFAKIPTNSAKFIMLEKKNKLFLLSVLNVTNKL